MPIRLMIMGVLLVCPGARPGMQGLTLEGEVSPLHCKRAGRWHGDDGGVPAPLATVSGGTDIFRGAEIRG
jgi:hypothetical protein